jgi:hypothetical protein
MFEGWLWRRLAPRDNLLSSLSCALSLSSSSSSPSSSSSTSSASVGGDGKSDHTNSAVATTKSTKSNTHVSATWQQYFAIIHDGVLFYFVNHEQAERFRLVASRGEDAVFEATPLAEGIWGWFIYHQPGIGGIGFAILELEMFGLCFDWCSSWKFTHVSLFCAIHFWSGSFFRFLFFPAIISLENCTILENASLDGHAHVLKLEIESLSSSEPELVEYVAGQSLFYLSAVSLGVFLLMDSNVF